MKQNYFKRVLMCLCLLAGSNAFAYDAKIDGICYNFSEDEAMVTSGSYSGSVVIPESVIYNDRLYYVTSIGDYAFYKCSGLTSVTIPNSVTDIGNYAFDHCSGLTSITIPNSVTRIGRDAFYKCSSLSAVNITDLTAWCNISFVFNPLSLAHHLYLNGEEIKDLVIPDDITQINNAFVGCSGLTSVTIPSSVTSIGNNAFSSCRGLTSVTIPNSVISIGNGAFSSCYGLTSVIIPNSVTSIGNGAFSGCNGLTSITIPESVSSIGDFVFQDCFNLTTITIPNSVTNIGNYAFQSCSNLTSITLPNSVTSIGDYVFQSCSNLTSVTIPNSVTSIGISAFSVCSSLTSITIPSSVTSIGSFAFQNCTSLTSITIPNSVTDICDYIFFGCTSLASVTIPGSVLNIGNNAFRNCSSLTSITIPNSVTSIGWEAFAGCKALNSVTIPNSVISIGSNAFANCGLTSITIPNSVTSISDRAFANCNSLTSITIEEGNPVYDSRNSCNAIIETATNTLIFGCQNTIIPESVTSIGSGAFSECRSLTSITIPESVTSIGDKAFCDCYFTSGAFVNKSALSSDDNWGATICEETNEGLLIKDNIVVACRPWATSVTIPNNVTCIGNNAFNGCSSLTSLTIPKSVSRIEKTAFESCSIIFLSIDCEYIGNIHIYNLQTLILGDNVKTIADNAFGDLTHLTTVIIGSGVTTIGKSAFYGCSGLTSVTIPNSVTSIGGSAFESCRGLTSITIPNSVISIGDGAFAGCGGLTSVVVEEGNSIYDSRNDCNAIIETATNTLVVGCQNTIIPEGVSSINYAAFYGCHDLTSITIPNSVTSIGEYAFSGCSGLTSITIPNSVTSIGKYTFSGCSGIKSISIDCTSVGNWFAKNKILQTLTLGEHVKTIEDSAFSGCTGLTTLNVDCANVGDWFSDNEHLLTLTIGEHVTSIGNAAFKGCCGLTSIKVGNNNKIYDSRNNCNAVIESATNALIVGCQNTIIPKDVTSIGDYAFLNCSGLTSVTIPESVTSIGNEAFSGCIGLTSVTFYCKEIGDWFSGLTSIKSVVVGNNVTAIGGNSIPESARIFTSVGKPLLLLWSAGYSNIKDIETRKELNIPTLIAGKKTASSITLAVEGCYPEFRSTINGVDVEKEGGTCITGLDPNTQYEFSLNLAVEDASYTTPPISIQTAELTLTTQQPKVISAGNVIVAAESNLDDEETNVGFEWRRTDWTDDFNSNTGGAYLYEGTMEGYIRNLYTEKLWKYRPYYESNSGNRYYGNWVGIDPTNTNYFEPTVHTYATITVTGNRAEVKGYAMRGTDKVTSQGFMYWPSNTSVSLRKRASSIPANAKVVEVKGNVMIAALEDLEYETSYCYVAFVTTEEDETFYGEVQTFSTDVDPDGIGGVKAEELVTEVARYDLNGRKLDKPQKGVNIIRMSDGTTRKVMIK